MTWKPVTKVSAHNVPIAAPMEPKIGINIKFNIKLEEKFNVQNMIKEGNFYKIPEDKLYVSNDILLDLI